MMLHEEQFPAPVPVLAAAYCRVSTEEASQEGSLEAQREHWRSYIAARKDWQPAGIYLEAGVSGTKAKTRPELMRLIEACAGGRVNLILTKSISRFSRNTVDCLQLIRMLRGLGVSVYFEKERIHTGEMSSELFLSLLTSFAEEESRSLSRNVRLGYRHRFLEGEFHYKRPPYGYKVTDGNLTVDPREGPVVEDIFEAVLKGMRPVEIAQSLTSRAIPTKYNATWTANTIIAILSNLTYTGDALFQKTYQDEEYRACVNRGEADRYFIADHHESIINREIFILANRRMGFTDPYEKVREVVPDLFSETAEADPSPSYNRKVTVIKADPSLRGGAERKLLRVAAYCRVSTDSEEQESSYEAQCRHYRGVIEGNPNWISAGIYADEGITGTSMARRERFNQMIADAQEGRIDLILTKSISRFARNTLDCLTVVRKLKKLGIGITFEKEGLNTLDETGEVILTILASIAQQESASISQNVRIGIQYRFQQGIPKVNCTRFLGYDKDKKGMLVINPSQAVLVRRIFRDFLDGFSVDRIAGDLRREGAASGTGSVSWPPSSVRYILQNEKYAGDLLLQKTLVADFLTHRSVRNKGKLPQYFVEDAHSPIIPKSVFQRVQEELWLRGQESPAGGNHYGSRRALSGRTFCRCGKPMRRLRRKMPLWQCVCGEEAAEQTVKAQVLRAAAGLVKNRREIAERRENLRFHIPAEAPSRLSANPGKTDRLALARAMRKDWQLGNLLPPGETVCFDPACRSEADFRARTDHAIAGEWQEDAILRILDHVVLGEKTVFRGGVEVPEALGSCNLPGF